MDKLFDAILAGIAEGATYGLVALGIVLVYKATRVLNFAQAEIGTLCIYIAWLLTTVGVPILLAVPIALMFAAVFGAGTEYILRPLSGGSRVTMTVATLGIATALGAFQITKWGPDPRPLPALKEGVVFSIGLIEFQWGRIFALLIAAGMAAALYLFFKRTLFGLGVMAAAQDQTALKLQGLPFNQVSMFTWASGAVLTAAAGIVLAPTIGAFTPFWILQSIYIPSLAAALIGGLTSLPGAFVGGITVGVIWNLAKFYVSPEVLPGPEFVAVFLAVAVVLIVRPQGLLGSEA